MLECSFFTPCPAHRDQRKAEVSQGAQLAASTRQSA
jgi:hypothetical protein